MNLFNKLQQAFDSHVESIVSEAIQKRQEDIVRQVTVSVKNELQETHDENETWKTDLIDIQQTVKRMDREIEELTNTVEMESLDESYLEDRLSDLEILDEYDIAERIDERVADILKRAIVTIEPDL